MTTLTQNNTASTWMCPYSGSLDALLCDHDGLTGIQHHGDRDWNTASLPFHGPLSVAVIVTAMGPFSWEHVP